MKILILGSGGREHAFAKKIKESTLCTDLFVMPGNGGTQELALNEELSVTDFEKIRDFVQINQIEMVVVGPEDPLVKGIVDFFAQDEAIQQVQVVGPSKLGAQLEGSKEFAKEFMKRHQIPTARYQSFTKETVDEGCQFLSQMKSPYVLKADGLAAGKGVLILEDLEEAQAELKNILLDEKFGEAGKKVVIEEFLDGIELSCFVLTDGQSYQILPTAKDYKRIGEADKGLNTGGMGAISPAPFADDALMQKIEDRIVKPTVEGLQKEKINYKGFIFIGLIKVDNDPYVIEYNVRMGDPETEVVFPRIKSDIVQAFQMLFDGTLEDYELEIEDQIAATVMLVSGGYPESYEKGKEITGLEDIEGSIVYHAGTIQKEGKLLTSGGRVLAITSLGKNLKHTLKTSYHNIKKIHFDGMYFRKDIGYEFDKTL